MADTQKFKKTEIIMLVIIIALAAAFGVILTLLLTKEDKQETVPNVGLIQYDEAAVALSEEDILSQIDDLQSKVEDGKMALRYQKTAYSSDGVNFKCEIGNSPANKYDMYINIYKDPELKEQILLTGLIPPGSGITEFVSEIPLDPGTYSTTLVLTQVENDHSTFHAQLMVVLELEVKDN